jgi:hypothetical protein
MKPFPEEKYHEYLTGGMLEVTLFGTYLVTGRPTKRRRA